MALRLSAALPLSALVTMLGACAAATPPPVAAVQPAPGNAGDSARQAARTAFYALLEASDADALERQPIARFYRGDFSQPTNLGRPFDPAETDADIAAAERDLAALSAIDRAALSPADQSAYDVFAYEQTRALELRRPEIRRFEELLPLDHFRGFHISYPRLSSPGGVMPFATVADYDAALARHAQVPAIVDRAIARMREGLAQQVVQPRLTVETMIRQLDFQLAQKTEDSPYWLAVAEMPDSFSAADRTRLTAAYRRAIEGELMPALRRLRTFLASDYLAAARSQPGLVAARDGAAVYDYRIAEMTTQPLTADAVHRLGLSEVARINGELAKARAEAGSRKPVVYRDKAALTEAWYAIGRRVDPLMPKLFSAIPKTPLEIRPYEEFREATNLAASYNAGNLENGKPGVFYFSGYNLANREVSPSVNLYMHEGNPGHHFQTMIAQENTALPAFLRYGGFTAFSEGWGLYAESLGYELGLYDDPVERINALAGGELLRAVRLVVDTGLHAKGWSRQQAVDYMVANGQEPAFAESEVARYTVMPGQALAYKIGELTIKRLRAKAQAALGDRFDVRDFHRVVLDSGDLPLTVLEAKVDRWIAAGGG